MEGGFLVKNQIKYCQKNVSIAFIRKVISKTEELYFERNRRCWRGHLGIVFWTKHWKSRTKNTHDDQRCSFLTWQKAMVYLLLPKDKGQNTTRLSAHLSADKHDHLLSTLSDICLDSKSRTRVHYSLSWSWDINVTLSLYAFVYPADVGIKSNWASIYCMMVEN